MLAGPGDRGLPVVDAVARRDCGWPEGEEDGLLDAARFMDSNECNTVIPAARYSYGKPLQQISDDFGAAAAKFGENVKAKFKREGEW